MKWFSDLKIARKMGVGFGLCLFFTVVIGVIGITRMSQLNTITGQIVEDPLGGAEAAAKLTGTVKQLRLYEFGQTLARSETQKAEFESKMQPQIADIDHGIEEITKTAFQPDDKANCEELKRRWEAYKADHDKQLVAGRLSDVKAGAASLTESGKAFGDVSDQLDKIADWNKKRGDQLAHEAAGAYASGRMVIIASLLVALGIGAFAGRFISRAITDTLAQVNTRLISLNDICLANLNIAVHALEQGDLTSKIPTGTKLLEYESKDELGVMAAHMNKMITTFQGTIATYLEAQQALNQLVGQTRQAADGILSGATEVSTGSEDLSQRTSEQAASLEETAASMEEMTATVKQNADNARQANQLAAKAREMAQQGGNVVQSAVASMNEISSASQRIADIITVIDEIAFQTNLLALNAAVEAARVGEQGRGFAVVAAEVRNLAGRSATAAKEIKALVQDTVAKVEEGSGQVNQSGETLNEIILSVKKVADVIAEISAASQEQSAGIDQVNQAVMQMDQITQQNASLVEETTAASQSMAQQAQSLQTLVAQFKLDSATLASLQSYHAPQQAARVEPVRMRATGTHGAGRPLASSLRTAPKLRLAEVDDSGFEEF